MKTDWLGEPLFPRQAGLSSHCFVAVGELAQYRRNLSDAALGNLHAELVPSGPRRGNPFVRQNDGYPPHLHGFIEPVGRGAITRGTQDELAVEDGFGVFPR